jgi:hypothetical protein
MDSQTLLSLFVGVGLAAACGFRVFVPLLVMSAAAQAGHLSLAPGFEWIGTKPALIAFAAATVLEVLGYFSISRRRLQRRWPESSRWPRLLPE